jgi:hypothetical protein
MWGRIQRQVFGLEGDPKRRYQALKGPCFMAVPHPIMWNGRSTFERLLKSPEKEPRERLVKPS